MRAAFILAAMIAFAPAAAQAHAAVREATPAANSTVRGSPAEIRIRFTKEIAEGSTITVTGPTGRVENGKPLVEPYVMRIGLKPLVAGKYTVQWHAMSADGHETDGRYTFTVSIPSAP
jgi:methionine-rich copper-binding protein CopC